MHPILALEINYLNHFILFIIITCQTNGDSNIFALLAV